MANPKKYNSFSFEEDERLIDFVKQNNAIYDAASVDYRNPALKNYLWANCGQELNRTADECQKRWTTIRDYYVRHKKNPGTNFPFGAMRKRMEHLKFLSDTSVSTRKKTRSAAAPFDSIFITDEINSTYDGYDFEMDANTSASYTSSPVSTTEYVDTNSESNVSFAEPLPAPKRKKQSRQTEVDVLMPDSKINMDIVRRITGKPLPNHVDMFFSSMCETIKMLPPLTQAELKLKIGQLVGEAEIKYELEKS